jgi:predicted ABC-type ATPase
VKKQLYVIAGCNGAGKTTASFTLLPDILDCREFVNADEIARGLSPFQPERVSWEAGRIMLARIQELQKNGVNFAFETTLATKSYHSKILQAQETGYHVTLLFFWLQHVELAIERVKIRVQEGGHDIEPEVIKRRYIRGIRNLFEIYWPLCDDVMIFDSSGIKHELIAEKSSTAEINVLNEESFNRLKHKYHESK